MAFVEPLAVFFDPETPGVFAAVINGTPVNGSLDRDFEESLDSQTQRMAPMFTCAKSGLPAVAVGDTLTANGSSYKVRSVEVDDYEQLAILHLNNP